MDEMSDLNIRTREDRMAYDTTIWKFIYDLERKFKEGRTKKQIENGFMVSMINPNFSHKNNVCFMIMFKPRDDSTRKIFRSVVFEYQKPCYGEEVEVGFKKHIDFVVTHKDFQEAFVFADAVYGIKNKEELSAKIDDFNKNKEQYVQKYYDELAEIEGKIPYNLKKEEKSK